MGARKLDRRSFLRASAAGVGALTLAPQFWHTAAAAGAPPTLGDGPYGPLGAPNGDGLRLPAGFTGRIVARAGEAVDTSAAYPPYAWHIFPDGGATFPTPSGGWVYVSNSELPLPSGGVSALRFNRHGNIVGGYRILSGTGINCSGGPTPWGTWLSCEERRGGLVWECDPSKPGQGIARPGLGLFRHEAAAVDPVQKRVYLTEDVADGRLYRFTPTNWPDLSAGVLHAAVVGLGQDHYVRWLPVDATIPQDPTTRVPGTTPFNGGEGCWYADGIVYFTTKGTNQVHAYNTIDRRLRVLYDDNFYTDVGLTAPLTGVDNVTVARSGDVLVAEDPGDLQIVLITPDRVAAPLLQLVGHEGSEIAGPAFDPSGKRLYFSSQRGEGFGITYEVTGPFRS